MSRSRHVDTITEYLIVAITPALVMLMVGSLVYFAINCFYVGSFDGRLYIATALFVFAAVLVSRISIDEGREYASMFAIPLSITTILSILRYTDASLLFLLPLVLFIWWSTDKLTWDCTVIDEKKDASGEGLLQTIGMDHETSEGDGDENVQEHLDAEATTNNAKTDEKSLWQRWVAHRQRNHTPGVWVIYFGIAAIPIFGIGQMLLQEQQQGPCFLLLCVYVGSALSLLMATSFLQMRRYLNQRRLSFSDQMAAVWLSTGGVLIVGLMLLCLLLPRPNTGYSLVDQFEKIGSRDQKASRLSFGKKNAVADEEQDGDGESDKEDATSDSNDGEQASVDAKKGRKSGDNAKTSGERKSESGTSESDKSDNSSDNSSGEKREDKPGQKDQPDRRSEARDSDNGESKNEGERSHGEQGEDNEEQQSDADKSSSRFNMRPSQLPEIIPNLPMPSIPKLVYFVIIGAVVLFAFLRYGREIGAAINAFFRDLAEMLRRLFGGKPRARPVAEEAIESEPMEPSRPFSSYPDPFAMGTADQYTPQQLVNYSFEALQAWAHERNCGRNEEQTPLEFAGQIGAANKKVGAAARGLAELYNQVAYAPGTIGKESLQHVQAFWRSLRARS